MNGDPATGRRILFPQFIPSKAEEFSLRATFKPLAEFAPTAP
jgi:hypothetical protein